GAPRRRDVAFARGAARAHLHRGEPHAARLAVLLVAIKSPGAPGRGGSMNNAPHADSAVTCRKAGALYALVSVRWGDAVLATKHLSDGGEAIVGAAVSTLLPLPCEPVGVAAVTVAKVHGGAPIAFVPRGAM